MMGRSCRSRGVCDGILYVNSGDDESTFIRKLKTPDYDEVLKYIELLQHVKILSANPC